MKLFKSVLKQGLKADAVHFVFTTGAPAQWTTSKGETKTLEAEVPDEVLMSQLLHEFFPHDQKSLAAGKAVRGRLAVVNHGELMLLGAPGGPASIQVFVPPAGEALFAAAWEKASRSSATMMQLPTDMFTSPPEEPVSASTRMTKHPIPLSQTFHESQPTKGHDALSHSTTKARELAPLPIPSPQKPAAPVAQEAPPSEDAWVIGESSSADVDWNPGSEMSVLSNADARFQVDPEELHDAETPSEEDDAPAAMDETPAEAQEEDEGIWATAESPAEAENDIFSMPADEAPSSEEAGTSDEAAAWSVDAPVESSEPPPVMESPWVMPPPPPMKNAAPPAAATPSASQVYTAATKINFGPHLAGETRDKKGAQLIDDVLRVMLQRKASDLHLSVGEPKALRVDGEVVRIDDKALTPRDLERLLLPILTPRHADEFAKDHDVDFAYEVPGLGRFRVNMYRDVHGVGAVFRMIPEVIPSFEQLKLPEMLRRFCDLEKGLVLVTGPTGSGKSTTLAAMIDTINRSRKEHILTIEDPVEFQHKPKQCLVHQREVHRHTQSFARALRAALREDPDTVLIGEMRDLETIAIALETAETGHLVFGTLHTNTAISTVDRIIDQFPANQQQQVRIMLAETLRGVVSQVLIKKRGGGRIAAHEILVVSKAVSSMIREGKTHMIQSHMQTKKSEGNILLNDSLTNLLNQGLIDAQEAYAKATDKDAMLLFLQKKGIATPFAA